MGTPIEHVYVFQLRLSELSPLSKSEKAALAVLCFVVSELNVLRKVSLFSMFSDEMPKDVRPAAAIQRNLFLRTMTAKLFEFLRLVEKKVAQSAQSDRVKEVLQGFSAEISDARTGIGFTIAKKIRNKMANHFDFEEVERTIDHCEASTDCSFYLAEANGNSYYPMGDDVVFASGVNRAIAESGLTVSFSEALDEWMDWTIKLSVLADSIHVALFEKLILPLNPDHMARQCPQWLPSDLVAYHPGFRLPIFIRVSK